MGVLIKLKNNIVELPNTLEYLNARFFKSSPNISTEDPRHPPTTGPTSSSTPNSQSSAGTMVKVDYSFIDLEQRLGLAQASLHTHMSISIFIKVFHGIL